MGRVRLLDERTVAMIAAGEVILNPAMAAKELVENALDAGAARIEIRADDSGYALLSVSDDGCGMAEEDALLALRRHATSKLVSADDLPGIATFGFRGEALPSMAAVSRMTLETAEPGAATGFRVEIAGGEIRSARPVPPRRGTLVELRDLFYNTPVRLKFQKAPRSEAGRIVEWVARYAAARPDVSFRLEIDGKCRIATPPGATLLQNAAAVWGHEFAAGLRPVDLVRAFPGAGNLRVHGLVSGPDLFRGNSKAQFFFVNGRPVENRALQQAVRQAYEAILPHGRHPVCLLFLELEPGEADINIHPAKKDVQFASERAVFSAVVRAIAEAFAATSVTAFAPREARPADETAPLFDPSAAPRLFAGEKAGAPPLDPAGVTDPRPLVPFPPAPSRDGADGKADGRSGGSVTLQRGSGGGAPALSPASSRARYIGRLFGTFLLAEREGELLVVDQHVASERIHYEALAAAPAPGEAGSQALLVPVVVDPDPAELPAWEAMLATFPALGFDVEPFGPGRFVVHSVPPALGPDIPRQALLALLAELVEARPGRPDEAAERILSTAACKRAVKAGDALNEAQAQSLLDGLFACANPYRCPHGRPIVVRVPAEDLLRKFGRI